MSKRVSELIRIDPLVIMGTTAAATAAQKINVAPNADKICIVCQVGCGSAAAGVSATAANSIQFSVLEATAATANGSAVSGATLTLGAATAAQARGVYSAVLTVTSNLTTATEIQINGVTYRTTQTGVGTVGEAVAEKLASAINGNATSNKLPHYRAVANYGGTGVILLEPDDDKGTGMTIITTAAAATIAPSMTVLQGVIEISGDKWSTVTPKYVGVSFTSFSQTTNTITVQLVRTPTGSPAFPGRVISLTT
jgi:hypothetical protein